ncbi:peptide ABC transporter permease [Marinicaulis flavus]|uniref:Peptide ABC transporter permease n=2 Tax=Hyphococcus luteus TaxID=2058213 RepID=A0A2S7K262_9PROT|nr:peptide ABC transporter permease [Marinicaulis flavus]
MTNTALLNNVDHADLRVIARHSAAFGDNINQALVFPSEYVEVQREYPIFFRKDANGEYQSLALLGLDEDENLFLDEAGWNARYVPATHARGPFLIGLQRGETAEQGGEPMIRVDLDHPRVSDTEEGEPVFLPQGGNAPYLERVIRALRIIHQGADFSKRMFAAFEECDLLELITVEIKLSDTELVKIPDRYTISQQRLGQLSGDKLESLAQSGFLYAAFLTVASLGNVSRLIEMKNRKRAGQSSL